jgi:hypothetical protein
MAKTKETTSRGVLEKVKKKRPGIHSKKKRSVHKTGKNYRKEYRGQGK